MTEFCKKLKVVSSDFSMIKNIVAPLFFVKFSYKIVVDLLI